MIEAGVDIVDIGGQSTRPGAVKIDAAQESERVVPVIEYALTICHSVYVTSKSELR